MIGHSEITEIYMYRYMLFVDIKQLPNVFTILGAPNKNFIWHQYTLIYFKNDLIP